MAAAKPANNTEQSLTLEIIRVFNAPRDLVWEAWTDPAHARQWMGPRDHPAVAMEQDARVGGKWSLTLRSVEGGHLIKQGGVFREIKAREKVVYTLAWDGEGPADSVEMLVTVTFRDEGANKTRVDFRQEGLPSKGERDGHEAGWNSTFDRMEDLLAVIKKPGAKISWLYPENDPIILGARLFDAPRELVWECFTRGEHMAKWWGPARHTAKVHEYDARVGGKWRISLISAEGASYNFFGAFLELKRPEIFVWTFGFDNFPPGEETYSFADVGGKTLLMTLSRFPDMASREGVRATDMELGAEESYERLDTLLKAL